MICKARGASIAESPGPLHPANAGFPRTIQATGAELASAFTS